MSAEDVADAAASHTVADVLREIADQASFNKGALEKCLRLARKAAAKGRYSVTVTVPKDAYDDERLRALLREEYGFTLTTRYDGNAFWYPHEFELRWSRPRT